QCSQSWHAVADAPLPAPEDDLMFSLVDESALDAAFEAEARAGDPPPPARKLPEGEPEHTLAEIRSALAPKPKKADINAIDPALLNKSRRAFNRRQAKISQRLPMARVRRTARIGAFVLLVSLPLLGLSLR